MPPRYFGCAFLGGYPGFGESKDFMSSRNTWQHCKKLVLICGIATAAWITAARLGAADTPATVPSTAPTTTPTADASQADSDKSTTVRRGDLQLALDFKGVFEPVQPFEVRLKTRQYHDDFIIKHAVASGTKVARGDVLIEFETDKIDTAIAAAENDLRIADANLVKAQADVQLGQQADSIAMSSAKQQLVNAQTGLKRWDDIDNATQLLIASMGPKMADFDTQSASDELDELKKMYKSEDLTNETADIVMKRAIRTLDLQKQVGQINHAAYDRYSQFEIGMQREGLATSVDQQKNGVDQLTAAQIQGAELRATALVTAKAADDAAKKNVNELNRDDEMFSISSAIDGIVVYGNFDHKAWHPIDADQFDPGEKAATDQVLMTVYRPGELRLTAECPENQVGYFSPGTQVQVTPTASPDLNYTGVCEPAPVVADASGQIFNIIVDLPSVDPRLAPGYSADVNFNAGTLHNVLLVPATAVWRDKVWTTKPVPGVKAGQPGSSIDEAKIVVIGASDGTDVQIKSGLSEGDVILTQAKKPAGQ
jgi:HlyD family secretion protein